MVSFPWVENFVKSVIENYIAVSTGNPSYISSVQWRQEFIWQGDCCYRKDGPIAVPVF